MGQMWPPTPLYRNPELLKRLYYIRKGAQSFLAAVFLMAAKMMFSSPLSPLAWMWVPSLFSMNFRAPFSLAWAAPGHAASTGQSCKLLGSCPARTYCAWEVVATVPRPAHVLGHLETLDEAHSHGAAMVEGSLIFKCYISVGLNTFIMLSIHFYNSFHLVKWKQKLYLLPIKQ